MNDKFYNNLKDDLKPYYSRGDCCSWIVELRKENNKLQYNWNSLREWLEETMKKENIYPFMVLDKMNELEGKDKNGTMD